MVIDNHALWHKYQVQRLIYSSINLRYPVGMKNLYLQRMGITAWQQRNQSSEVVSVAPECFFCTLLNAQNVVTGVIFADIDETASFSDQQGLLEKIAKAVSSNINLETMSLDRVGAGLPDNVQHVILLGEEVAKAFESINCKVNTICSVSLSELQKDASQKKALWQQLKPLVQ